ncbi:SOS response-associated peptidase [Sphingomonas piscis]|uniref:Abasic site processing protein n=1 Tax=Sphingomonas piscis TaxID=2714943 RepID=A0A6G7YLZ5_9SPHN|nr:SOS response-associated peptidase family protein [Sphingomonas piscis]QIK77764.1 SOS response-associated peptidase [Sphingomonas piscis]
MCNLYTQTSSVDAIRQVVKELGLPLRFPEGAPNLQPRDICITDPAPILRAAGDALGAELIVRRWSWPGPGGKPVYNYRSDGREFGSGRCLILADGFYEFTAPSDPKQKRKDRWLFADPSGGLLGIAGLVRTAPEIGEAFTMLTTEPGPDVAPYHSRQVALLDRAAWTSWLDGSVPARELIRPLPGGSLTVSPSLRT